jgi:hypothetical protein
MWCCVIVTIPSHPPISSLPSSYHLPQLLCPSQGPICGPGSVQWGVRLVVGDAKMIVPRVCHGYGKTRGFRVTGFAGTGTVPDLAHPRITAYPCHGITGMLRVTSSGLPVRVKINYYIEKFTKKFIFTMEII